MSNLEALQQEVFKLLEQRPSVACKAELLDAVYDCPADCRWMHQLLGRWGAPVAAAKLVEGEGAHGQLTCARGTEGRAPPL